jgi:hypothetical protein
MDAECEYCGRLHRDCNLLIFDGGIKRFACNKCTKTIQDDGSIHVVGEVKSNGAINVGRANAGKIADVYLRDSETP